MFETLVSCLERHLNGSLLSAALAIRRGQAPRRYRALRAFSDLEDLVSDQAMSLSMHGVGRLRIWGFDKAEDLTFFLIHPVAKVFHIVLSLLSEILHMGLGDSLRRRSRKIMNIHIQWHKIHLLK
jgi:hypothetical protein